MERVKQSAMFFCFFFKDLTVERMPSACAVKCAVKIGRASANFQI